MHESAVAISFKELSFLWFDTLKPPSFSDKRENKKSEKITCPSQIIIKLQVSLKLNIYSTNSG